MTTITLPRATVEQALEALEWSWGGEPMGTLERDAITALRAALAQQAEPDHETRAELAEQQVVQLAEERDHYRNLWQKAQQAEPVEPVAWRWGYRSVTTGEMDWRGYVEIAAHPNLRSPEIIMEPLYTAPPQRKPLTKEQLLYIYNQLPNWGMDMDRLPQGLEKFARAIERAHGIPMPEGDPK